MKAIIIECTWSLSALKDRGWGNGYVLIPETSPLSGMHYDEINRYVSVHGGLTFSESVKDITYEPMIAQIPEGYKNGWVVGFDTAHWRDTIDLWPKEKVWKETLQLKEQLESLILLT